MNVGASKPSDYGLYFQWGDTQGSTADQVGTGEDQKKFAENWSDYKWGVYPNFTKYTTIGATLELEDDAAHVHMGGDWHMPSPDQIKELIDNTTSSWTTSDSISGMTFTSTKDSSKSIFIPAAGAVWEGSVNLIEARGYVWSSMLSPDYIYSGQYLQVYEEAPFPNLTTRSLGMSVRGVIG